MAIPRTITVSSRALGGREKVTVKVYETQAEMLAAASRYNGQPHTDDTLAVTQVTTDQNGRTQSVIIRLFRGKLSTEVIVHEVHHASTAIYGAHVGDRISRRAHLNHHNEPFAYLHGELCAKLNDRLHALGYYGSP